jgi:hypothetical protein
MVNPRAYFPSTGQQNSMAINHDESLPRNISLIQPWNESILISGLVTRQRFCATAYFDFGPMVGWRPG